MMSGASKPPLSSISAARFVMSSGKPLLMEIIPGLLPLSMGAEDGASTAQKAKTDRAQKIRAHI